MPLLDCVKVWIVNNVGQIKKFHDPQNPQEARTCTPVCGGRHRKAIQSSGEIIEWFGFCSGDVVYQQLKIDYAPNVSYYYPPNPQPANLQSLVQISSRCTKSLEKITMPSRAEFDVDVFSAN